MNSFSRSQWGAGGLALLIGLFLFVFLIVPVVKVVYVAFQDPNTGALTLINFVDFFNTSLFRESFLNSIYVAGGAVLLASLISIPLAYFTTRFNFGGAVLIQTLGIVPLIMPPFVGAVAMLLLFGENGSVNLLIDEWFGFTIPFMEGLNGVTSLSTGPTIAKPVVRGLHSDRVLISFSVHPIPKVSKPRHWTRLSAASPTILSFNRIFSSETSLSA